MHNARAKVGIQCRWGRRVFTRGGGGSIEPPKPRVGGFGKRAQLTIITVEKKLRAAFGRGYAPDFGPFVGDPLPAGVM